MQNRRTLSVPAVSVKVVSPLSFRGRPKAGTRNPVTKKVPARLDSGFVARSPCGLRRTPRNDSLGLLRRLDARRLDRGGVGVVLLLERRLGLLKRQPTGHDTELGQALGKLRRFCQGGDFIAQRRDNRLRRGGRREKAVP